MLKALGSNSRIKIILVISYNYNKDRWYDGHFVSINNIEVIINLNTKYF